MGGIDRIKNGLLFGALFGVLLAYAAKMPSSFLSFLGTWSNSVYNWLVGTSWGSWVSSLNSYFAYVFYAIIGAIVGGYIDYK